MNLQNVYKLGYKEATSPDSYADHLLGVEASFDDVDLNSSQNPKPLKSASRVKAVWVQSASATPMKPGAQVKCSIVRKTVSGIAGAAEVVDGIVDPYLTSDVANGERFYLIVEGPVPTLSGAAYAVNAPLAANASGKAVAGASSGLATSWGRALELASAADQLKRSYVNVRHL